MSIFVEVRGRSLDILSSHGYQVSPTLPFLGDCEIRGDSDSIGGRLLGLHAVVALAFGWDERKNAIRTWLKNEQLSHYLSPLESKFVFNSGGLAGSMRWRVEALFALAWASNLTQVSILDPLPDDFVSLFPSISKSESTTEFRQRVRLRSTDDILRELDLLYCLASAKTELHICGQIDQGNSTPTLLSVQQRRHALEWILSEVEWEEVLLDT
ncbi:hypothetical protein CR152_29970 [Massilia violaceinigra]|uniref:DUF4272 domain-containing protein n=1 Tax=Massilia violaceinigra TaxID=2045208 RepID=A0A2D2DTF9_9BURK|nr:DUF4272 domain-containing protein [Massilia violaceinigra]ATQ78265.1 hypothetical protein CR152_29970 [Massilia violaceinigra]